VVPPNLRKLQAKHQTPPAAVAVLRLQLQLVSVNLLGPQPLEYQGPTTIVPKQSIGKK
jgi:hypothetical protein